MNSLCVRGICMLLMSAMMFHFACNVSVGEPPTQSKPTEKKKMLEVTGEFSVKMAVVDIGDPLMGMMTLDKQYLGDLAATGKGRMLTGMTAVKASAGYVAIERVEGTLKGAKGSFLIQHSGIMNKGVPTLVITVIPDSGTGDLTGIEGKMHIDIVEKKHFYRFEYVLPVAK